MRNEGFTELVCDRGGCKLDPVYASKEKIDLLGWGRIEHIDASGASRTYDLCPGCYAEYLELKKAQDSDTMRFMNGGE